jgi:anti-sigma regulatory factor (Ser/Thr protein kinase)
LRTPVVFAVTESSQVGEARREAARLAALLGFDETGCGKVSLVVTEAANNLVKHARNGLILLQPLEQGAVAGIEILALDQGPGMVDVSRCRGDGFSTAASPGNGLGAIARLADFMDIYSIPTGTALLARLWDRCKKPLLLGGRMHHAAISLPKQGQDVCGDAWAVQEDSQRTLLMIVDGLGHGPLAAEAARTAVRAFRNNASLGTADILQTIHAALRSTRGAAVAVAAVDFDAQEVRFAGAGNIAGTVLVNGGSRSLVSHNGIVGHEVRKFQEFSYAFPPTATLVMHSDGLATRWNLNAYPGLVARDPALIAAFLYRDFQRGRDDVTVLVAQAQQGA